MFTTLLYKKTKVHCIAIVYIEHLHQLQDNLVDTNSSQLLTFASSCGLGKNPIWHQPKMETTSEMQEVSGFYLLGHRGVCKKMTVTFPVS